MQRVHRSISREQVEGLRDELTALVPESRASIAQIIKLMRLITRKSQAEYARFCGIAPRVLVDLEAGRGTPRTETLEKLIRPFGYRVGIVSPPAEEPVRSLRAPRRTAARRQTGGG